MIEIPFMGEAGNFLFASTYRPAVELTHPSLPWVLGLKHLVHEADCLLLLNTEVKESWSLISTLSLCLHDLVLKHRDSFV
jgi:hypothetical protein